jgi:hypothetical protein
MTTIYELLTLKTMMGFVAVGGTFCCSTGMLFIERFGVG